MHYVCGRTNKNLGLLILRLTLVGIFLQAGIMKLMNIDMVTGFFAMSGLGAAWVWIVALTETIGGAAVILGLYTRFFASTLAVIMLVVILFIKKGMGFNDMMIDVVLLGLALGIALIGCGRYSLCRVGHSKDCATCKADGNDHCGCTCEVK